MKKMMMRYCASLTQVLPNDDYDIAKLLSPSSHSLPYPLKRLGSSPITAAPGA